LSIYQITQFFSLDFEQPFGNIFNNFISEFLANLLFYWFLQQRLRSVSDIQRNKGTFKYQMTIY